MDVPAVAVVMSSFAPGGTEHQMIELLKRLDAKRWVVHVAALHQEGAWRDRISQPITPFPLKSFKRPNTLGQVASFVQWCRRNRIALVHTADLPANIFGLPAAALAGVPVRIGNRRDINPGRSRFEIVVQRSAYAFATRVVANSRAAAERLRHELVPERKLAVITNGLDLARFRPRPAKSTLRSVIVVANLRPEKGHAVLIEAAARVLHAFPDAWFELVGGGQKLGALTARAERLGIAHRFAFRGHRSDIPECLAAADIFVLPSRSEACPNALLEAMAAGLPVVASAVGGVPELIENGETGLLVPAGDAVALADRLCRLMADAELGARLGRAARLRVESRHSFDQMAHAFERLYLSELGRCGVIETGGSSWLPTEARGERTADTSVTENPTRRPRTVSSGSTLPQKR